MLLTPESWQAIALTLKLAGLTTLALLLIATPLAWWLAQTSSRWRAPITNLTIHALGYSRHQSFVVVTLC
jgi:molybdate transport system permease protein